MFTPVAVDGPPGLLGCGFGFGCDYGNGCSYNHGYVYGFGYLLYLDKVLQHAPEKLLANSGQSANVNKNCSTHMQNSSINFYYCWQPDGKHLVVVADS